MKNPHTLLKICNKNSGKILKSKDVLKLFGYSEKTNLNETIVYLFVISAGLGNGRGSPSLWKVGCWSLLTSQELWGVSTDGTKWKRRVISNNQYLFPKDLIPWWKLKEYGGKL